MTDADRIQQHLNMLRGEPLVRLTGRQACEQAYRLRLRGLAYTSVAMVMGVYHGEWYSAERWSMECRRLGAQPSPRGNRRERAA